MAKVRLATEDDIPALVQLGAAMHAESPRYNRFAFDAEKTQGFIRNLVVSPVGFAAVAEEAGALVGMLGGIAIEHFFGHDLTAVDVAVYVAPAHRGGSIALRLVQEFEHWAQSVGAREALLGVSTEVQPERTSKLYTRLGYRLSGYLHLKDL